MKKAVSILLSVIITLSALVGAVIVPASAALADATYFETVSNWRIYANTTIGASSTVASSANIFSNTTADYINEGTTSLHMNGNARVAAIPLAGIEKGKKYTLSFKFYAPTGTTLSSSGYFLASGIYKTGVSVSNTGDMSGAIVSGKTPANSLPLATWHDYSVTFDCTDTTDLYFALRLWFGGSSNDTRHLYFDNFKLEEQEVPSYYDEPTNWISYKLEDTLGGTTASGTATASKDTTTSKTGSSSVKMANMHGNMAAIKLDGLVAGKTYKFSLWYKANYSSGYTKYTLQAPGLYKGGSKLTADKWGQFYIADSVAALGNQERTDKETWYQIQFQFKAPEEDVYFATRSWLGVNVWFDDITVEEVEVPSRYDDPANWSSYKLEDILGGTSTGTATAEKDTTTSKTGSSSVKMKNMHGNIAAVKLEGLTAGKTYKFGIWYKGAFASGYTKYTLQAPGLYTVGTKLTKNNWGHFSVADAVISTSNQERTNADEWYQVEFVFTAPDKDVYFATRSWLGATVWFDDATLEEQEVLSYYDNADNWKLSTRDSYIGNPADSSTGGSGYSISVNSDPAFINTGSTSLKVYANGYGATTKMEGVEAGKSYAFSFKFLMPAGSTISSIGKPFWYSGIYAAGTKYNETGTMGIPDTSAAIAVGSDPLKANVTAGQWHDYRIEFGVPEDQTDLWFNMSYWWAAGFTLYYDDIKLEELPYEVKPLLYHDYDNPPVVTEITFDDNRPYSFQASSTMKIDKAPERDGKQTNALRIMKGDHSVNAFLNWNSVVGQWGNEEATKDSDPVFTIPVKENTLYNFSVWMYLEEGGRIIYGDLFPDYNGHRTLVVKLPALLNKKAGQWVKYEDSFQTTTGQTKASVTVNFGKEISNDVWFDDIRLEEQLPGVLDGAEDGTYCEEPYNQISEEMIEKITSAKTGAYELQLAPSALYTFGITASGSNKTSVYLSLDGVNPLEAQNNLGIGSVISPNATEKRYGYTFITNNTGKMYVVVKNPDNSLKLSTPQVFLTNVANTGESMGYTEDPNVERMEYDVIDLVVDGQKNSANDTNDTADSDLSPQTGETNTALVVMLLSVVSALIALLAITKRKETVVKNEQ